MGLRPLGELISLLSTLGYTWPEADETKLFEMGQRWVDFSGRLQTAVADSDAAVQQVWADNAGQGIDAFKAKWTDGDSPAANLRTGATGAMVIGAGLMVMAGVVLALKINMIVQLTILVVQIAQAGATAIATGGASLLEIPFFKIITGLIIDQLTNLAMNMILGE